MKKCGIITFSHAINYGAVLQTYALQHYLKIKLNVEAEVISYASDRMLLPYKKRSLLYYFKPKVLASTILRNSCIRYNCEGFEKFRKKNISFSGNLIRTKEELLDLNDKYEFFITGSDQVFNIYCSNFDYNYLLEFVKDDKKKNSYSASLGITLIPEEYKSKYKDLLGAYNMISVREFCSAEILEPVIGKKPAVTVDPTLLLNKKSWMEISEKVDNLPQRYVLLYMISEDREVIRAAKDIAREKGIEIIYISDRLFKPMGVRTLRKMSPGQWVFLFANAEIVLTNSYHGMVFSCIFEKKIIPFFLKTNVQVNSRIKDFLNRYGLSKLVCSDAENKRECGYDVNYVQTLIEKDRAKSEEFLSAMVRSY
ncbi:polysaccharide pyruvyl transferase family protein [Fibrobacter sp.]|uniref:polysaccharide pyruvyl transferase family protein n=1 Tax=Fibrobacter sp. TaxID=35828 RepID=UPI00388D59C0